LLAVGQEESDLVPDRGCDRRLAAREPSLMTASAPQIQSIGAPPDIHAERIVRAQMRWLQAQRQPAFDRMLDLVDVDRMGTIIGQHKVCDRILKAGGDALLSLRLKPGSRGRFELQLFDWSVWDPATKTLVENGRPMPETGWLAAVANIITGRHRRFDSRSHTLLLLTHHAAVRLTQRCGIRDVQGLLLALRDLWLAVSASVSSWDDLPTGEWRVPMGGAVAVLERDRTGASRLVCKTILGADMVMP
jgi:hypothetical protein